MDDYENEYESEYIGTALALIRQRRGISQESLAEMLTQAAGEPVTPQSVDAVEAAQTRVSWERLARFCNLLGCLPSQVIRLAEMLLDGRDDSEEAVALLRSFER